MSKEITFVRRSPPHEHFFFIDSNNIRRAIFIVFNTPYRDTKLFSNFAGTTRMGIDHNYYL